MPEAYCDCTGDPNRYYFCRDCGSVREDVYRGDAIAERRWHNAPDVRWLQVVRHKAVEFDVAGE
jgi:hypothetical protein